MMLLLLSSNRWVREFLTPRPRVLTKQVRRRSIAWYWISCPDHPGWPQWNSLPHTSGVQIRPCWASLTSLDSADTVTTVRSPLDDCGTIFHWDWLHRVSLCPERGTSIVIMHSSTSSQCGAHPRQGKVSGLLGSHGYHGIGHRIYVPPRREVPFVRQPLVGLDYQMTLSHALGSDWVWWCITRSRVKSTNRQTGLETYCNLAFHSKTGWHLKFKYCLL